MSSFPLLNPSTSREAMAELGEKSGILLPEWHFWHCETGLDANGEQSGPYISAFHTISTVLGEGTNFLPFISLHTLYSKLWYTWRARCHFAIWYFGGHWIFPFLLMGFNFYQLTLMEARLWCLLCGWCLQAPGAIRACLPPVRAGAVAANCVPRMQRHHRLCSKEHLPKCLTACSFPFIHGPSQSWQPGF